MQMSFEGLPLARPVRPESEAEARRRKKLEKECAQRGDPMPEEPPTNQ